MKLSLPPKLIVGGLRLIVVVIQLGAVKIYVVAVEALRKKETQDETQFTTKIDSRFATNCSSYTVGSSGGAKAKGKTG
jgi:hypothetical protein